MFKATDITTEEDRGLHVLLEGQLGSVKWERSGLLVGYSRLIGLLGFDASNVNKYIGCDGGKEIGSFHIMLGVSQGVNYLIMPPGGIKIADNEIARGYVVNLHELVLETASKNKARIFAIIDRLGEYFQIMSVVEKAGYTRSGVNMGHNLIVLNYGVESSIDPLFMKSGFKALPQ